MKRKFPHILISFAIAVGLAMAAPGGVVVEGRLSAAPQPGTSSPLTITLTKGNLEYFGRLLISMPSDCKLKARQLHGGGMTVESERNLAVISWLKLPDSQQFDLLFDLEVSPQATPGPRSFEWDFSFIRNNERETVRPTPFHFDVVGAHGSESPRDTGTANALGPKTANAVEQQPPSLPSATRTVRTMKDGQLEVRIELRNVPNGGFVKCLEQIPEDAIATITSGGGSTVQTSSGAISFVWFDFQSAGAITYIVQTAGLHEVVDFIGSLSLILDDTSVKIPVINHSEVDFQSSPDSSNPSDDEDFWYEVQVAATKNRVVTDYFEQKLNFSHPLVEESELEWTKYLFGHFDGYRSARECREDFNERFDFIGPFVVAKRNGMRVSVQEALTRKGDTWIP